MLSNSDDTPASSNPAQTTCNPKILKSRPQRILCAFCNLIVKIKTSRYTFKDVTHHQIQIKQQITIFHPNAQTVIRAFPLSEELPRGPTHVQKCTSGNNHQVNCELEQCKQASEFYRRSGLMGFQCIHVKSLSCCPISSKPAITLTEEVLSDMVKVNF